MSRALAAILAASVAACGLGQDDGSWVTAREGELVVGVDVTGQLASTESHPLGPPPVRHIWNFKIAHLATEGDSVKKGTPVIGFDTSDLRREIEEYQNRADTAAKELEAHRASARMALEEYRLAVEQAKAAERKAELKTAGGTDVMSTVEVEKARLDYELAKYATTIAERKLRAKQRQNRAELQRLKDDKERAESRVAQIRSAMGQMRVAAPIDGTVLHVTDWQGNKKKVGDSAWRAEKIVEIVSLDHMKGEGEVDEMDASRVSVGQTVRVRLDANQDVELTGEVVQIEENVGRRAPEDPLKVVKLEIELAEQDAVDLRPGMRFRGAVETDRVTGVLMVPLAAVFAAADGAYVYKRDGSEAVPTKVTLGRRGTDMVEVTRGLEPGDRVALIDEGAAEASR